MPTLPRDPGSPRSLLRGVGCRGSTRRSRGRGGQSLTDLLCNSCSSAGPAPTGQGTGTLGHAAGRREGSPENELDLRVAAPQLVTGPPRNGVVDNRVQSQEDTLAFNHRRLRSSGYREPVLTTGWVTWSLHSTTSRLDTIAALRS